MPKKRGTDVIYSYSERTEKIQKERKREKYTCKRDKIR